MTSSTPVFIWTSENVNWLADALDRLNYTYQDLDNALGYAASRGSYTRQIVACGRAPSHEYVRRLLMWWAAGPQPLPPKDFLFRIRTIAVPFLRMKASQGHPVERCYSRRRGTLAKQRLGPHAR